MKILDLHQSFVRGLIAKKAEKIAREKLNVNSSIILSELTINEDGDKLMVNVEGQLVLSRKDLITLMLD